MIVNKNKCKDEAVIFRCWIKILIALNSLQQMAIINLRIHSSQEEEEEGSSHI